MPSKTLTPAVPWWTCGCGVMNADHRTDCLWCGDGRGDAPTQYPAKTQEQIDA